VIQSAVIFNPQWSRHKTIIAQPERKQRKERPDPAAP
jgi:hypothetical protein